MTLSSAQGDTALMCGNNLKQNTTALYLFTTTIKNLKPNEKKLFGGITQRGFLIEKLQKSLTLLLDKFFTQSTQLKKDLASPKMINASKTIIVRKANKEDVPFLFSTYLKHNWYDKRNSTMLPKMVWTLAQRKRLQKVFDEQRIKVACLSDDPEIILGYGFIDNDKKPFIYVKLAWRNSPYKIEELLKLTLEKEQQ